MHSPGSISQGSISQQLAALAIEAGFSAAGIAAVPAIGSEEHERDAARCEEWIASGASGEMEYLQRRNPEGQLLRSSLRNAFPWARSVIVCVTNYNAAAQRSIDAAEGQQGRKDLGWIARYAWTSRREPDGSIVPSDYHRVLLKRLRIVEAGMQALCGPFESRCFVDTGPVVERLFARYAGVGWTGKNTCLINQKLGSWLFLAVIVTSIELPQAEHPRLTEDRCGSCRRCVEACPTNALATPYQMDASRCISYLTIEKRGEIPVELRPHIGRQVFGCDICQDVCPWNRKAPITIDDQLAPRPELINPALDWLGGMNEADFERTFNGSPVRRTKFSGLRRNVAIAMGNSRLHRFLPRLQQWATDEDPVLAETARWAIAQIQGSRPAEDKNLS
ncbi:MAG TPA: tRNA epoxyqueuosine(34) reductase QueG [Acidisarcina sp.]|nr:tRNA epoxyqueuosine(34) reductase QueG [Acidisarcina sp.]